MLFSITLIVFTSGCTYVEYKEVNPFVKVEEVPKVGIEPDAETVFKQATKGSQEKQTIAAAENNAIDIENKSKTQGLTSEQAMNLSKSVVSLADSKDLFFKRL